MPLQMIKKILILGANFETASLVKTAKKMGIYTIVTDYLPDSYAKRIADAAYDIDGMDIEGLVELVRKEKIDGVMVGTADPLVPSYYKVCEMLGLPCYVTMDSVEAFTNKKKLKEVCAKFGIQGVPEYTLKQLQEDGAVRFPIMIKPVDGRSGMGVRVCRFSNEVPKAIEEALAVSRCKEFIIEQYMDCEDVLIYYTFAGGQYYLSAMADRYTYKAQEGKAPVVLGGVYPSKYINLYKETLHEKMCSLFRYLHIENGVLMIQAFVEDGKFYVYDPGFRLQGAATHILIDSINGFDQQKMLINFALTGKMAEKEVDEKNDYFFHGKVGASQTILLKKGIIKKISGIDEVGRFPEVISVTQRLFEGDEVRMPGTEQQVLVRFHIVCETKEKLRTVIEKINLAVHAWDIEGNEMCLGKLQADWIGE